jgi:hypothetical protein
VGGAQPDAGRARRSGVTALLGYVGEQAQGFRILRASGVEAEITTAAPSGGGSLCLRWPLAPHRPCGCSFGRMDLSRYSHTETTTIASPPEVVYDLVADVTRMGEWSPVCTGAVWHDDERTRFIGTSTTPERTWSTHCRVDVADRGREFAFVNLGPRGDAELVRWGYTFMPVGDGTTTITESWQVLDAYADFIAKVAPGVDVIADLDGVRAPTAAGMAQTLASLKAAAESSMTPERTTR